MSRHPLLRAAVPFALASCLLQLPYVLNPSHDTTTRRQQPIHTTDHAGSASQAAPVGGIEEPPPIR